MRNIVTLAQRELATYFFSPIAYVVLALFLALSGFFFGTRVFEPGGPASLRQLFEWIVPLIVFFALPVVTMRLMSEELRSGTIESLMTAPVTDVEVILGKFFGVLVFYVAMLATTVVHWIMIALYSTSGTDVGATLTGYFGLLLLGSLYLAVGLFFSTCTRNQVIAALASLVLLGFFMYLPMLVAPQLTGAARAIVQHAWIQSHYDDFARGLIDLNHLLFFLSGIVFFLFLSVKVLESKRWR